MDLSQQGDAQSLLLDLVDDAGLAQLTLALLGLVREDVALVHLAGHHFARSRDFKSFLRGPVGLHFWHLDFPLVCFLLKLYLILYL